MYIFDCKHNLHVYDWAKCTCIWLNKIYMYLTKQNVHVFDGRQNVHVFDYNQMYMYLTKQNVHVFDWTKCTSIWFNKMYMYYQ
jgi:hypothetical protein